MINTNLKLASGLHEARVADINRHLTAPSRFSVRRALAARKNS